MPLFILFVIIPIIEITLFIQVGGMIGTPLTIAIIVVTAAIGSLAIRSQGRAMLRSFTSANMGAAADLLSQGLLLFVAGMFLITPGFLTDFLGLSLLVPPIRRKVRDYLMRRMTITTAGFGASAQYDPQAGDPQSRENRARSDWSPQREAPRAKANASPSDTAGSSNPNSPWRDDAQSADIEDARILGEDGPKR